MRKMKLNAQERAHEAIRLNKLLGLKGTKTINEVKIQRYKRTHPNQTKITLAILANLRLSKGQTLPELFEIIAKEAECNVSEVRKFFLHTIDSVLLNERRIGKQLVTPALIKFAKKFVFSAEQTEQTAKVVTTKKVVSTDTKEASYESQGKVVVRERLKELLVDKKSPKEGEILTLANLFQFEIELLKQHLKPGDVVTRVAGAPVNRLVRRARLSVTSHWLPPLSRARCALSTPQ